MAIQFSVAVRNAMLDAWGTAIGASPKLQFWSGTMPSNCAASSTGTKLVEFSLGSTWNSSASSGAKSLTSLPLTVTSITGGTAGYYRIMDSAGTTCHEQGTLTATGGGGDMTIDNTTVGSSQTIQVTAYTKTAPGA